jgi:UDP-N-acetylglucosamine transferase subunit ALG13
MSTGERTALVTVGTTKFDALIRGIDRESFLQKLVKLGFNSVLVQQGQGDYSVQLITRGTVPGIRVR